MSAPATRRIKDPNACAGQKLASGKKPSKALTPISTSSKNPSFSLQKSSSGKENPLVGCRAFGSSQKPVIRPVPRVEKSAVSGGIDNKAGVRLSASSATRGRSQSPSEFIRVFSDLKKEKGSRVSVDKEELGVCVSRKISGSAYSGAQKVEIENKINGFSSKSSRVPQEINSKLDSSEEKSEFASKSEIEKIGKSVSFGLKRESLDSTVKIPEISKEKGSSEGSIQGTNKNSSKLHQKLAFLEGKVRRIASDIKKTKDILEMNNPDASKVILSDIQEKISGIEKAMSHVVTDSGDKLVGPRKDENEKVKTLEGSGDNQKAAVNSSVKGLNSEELEDRLFPHHKLLRNRTHSKASVDGSKSYEPVSSTEHDQDMEVEDKPASPNTENPIALEFLASHVKESSRDTISSDKDSQVQETDREETSSKPDPPKPMKEKSGLDDIFAADETLDESDLDKNTQEVEIDERDSGIYQINEMGKKACTGGWFVSEGEAALLAHDDGSCSYYDVANSEVKSVYKPPTGILPNIWRDCWIIRAAGSDGCSERYVVAASAGNTVESGFCSWDFYTNEIKCFHFEKEFATVSSRTALAPISNNTFHGRNTLASTFALESRQWWYKPSGPLIISAASSQRTVKVFDIRDGEPVMRWEVNKPIAALDFSSPLQWRNRGKIVTAEVETVSVWDVNSLHPEALSSVSSSGRKITAIHINNTDAELGAGIRQRVSSSEAEGHDGVFCTTDSINILDFRHPSGIGAKIPKLGFNAQSIFSRNDSVFLGGTNLKSTSSSVKTQLACQVQQFSLRKQRLVSTYSLPESDSRSNHASAITQVWGNSNLVMAVSELGLSVFDATENESLNTSIGDYGSAVKVKETIGPNDMYAPSFDYLGSRVLVISRDRPALWRYLF